MEQRNVNTTGNSRTDWVGYIYEGATLLRPNKATNFSYGIEEEDSALSNSDIERINNIATPCKIRDRIKAIEATGAHLYCKGVYDATFNFNLGIIDSNLQTTLTEIVLDYYTTGRKNLKELTERITERNPFMYDLSFQQPFYEHKIKRFLKNIGMGMNATAIWDGNYDTIGAFLIGKDGEQTGHFYYYESDEFMDFLYSNTYLATANSEHYGFGKIERTEGGELEFKLNLQVRLK
jgi:hypothetical protein